MHYKPLEIVDEKAIADACTYKWFNQTLCKVNDSVVRMGVFEGEYHWHKHDNDDEFFYVFEGRLLIDLEGRVVELSPRERMVVPKGVMHRTRAEERRSFSWSRMPGLFRPEINTNWFGKFHVAYFPADRQPGGNAREFSSDAHPSEKR